MKVSNLSRHYNTSHKDKYDKYTGAGRAAILADLKGKVQKQQRFFTQAASVQESSLKASYAVSLQLAKAKKPLSEGEMVKKGAIEMANAFGDAKMAKNFESVSLSQRTVTRRIFDIQSHVEGKLKRVMADSSYFSLALDESTDVTDVSQLLVYARSINASFDVHEELLKLVPLHGTTKGSDIFDAVKGVVSEYGGFDKLSAVVTDGAPSMQGRRTGFAGLLRQSGVDCPILHCIIHQEALCAKHLNFKHVMDVVTKVTNLIRGGNRSLNHRKFMAFLEEVDAAYGDLQLHTDIRWMSRGKCLERFYVLRLDIPVFLENSLTADTSVYCDKLRDPQFLCDMAFLTDITGHLNYLNVRLQGKDQTVSDLFGHVNGFQRKLGLFKDNLASDPPNLTHFPACGELRKDIPECETTMHRYREAIETLQDQFNDRFQDFHDMRGTIQLFTDPLSAVVNDQPPKLQMELCELQGDAFFQMKRNERGVSFWILLPETRFPLLRDFALKQASMFGSTYICESNFSTMKHIKSKERNRLSDETLFHLMQLGCTGIDVDIPLIVRQHDRLQVSH
ncbi:general transcription factor II-I repeat domain-containing protein 2B-like [Centroberyx gerrardi]